MIAQKLNVMCQVLSLSKHQNPESLNKMTWLLFASCFNEAGPSGWREEV